MADPKLARSNAQAAAVDKIVDKAVDKSVEMRPGQSIALLKERRAALITAAVTGQIPLNQMKP